MRKLLLTLLAGLATILAGMGTATAQDDSGPRQFAPVEVFACNYNNRRDQDDFDEALALLEAGSNAEGAEPYAAFRLLPMFYGTDQEFDFIYVGVWPDGSTMGRDYDNYFETGQDTIDAWNDAVTCDVVVMFASVMVKAPPDGGPDDNFMLTISDCEISDGQEGGDMLGALEAYGQFRSDNGSPGGTYAWFPAYGGGDAEYDFKLVNGHANAEAFGNHFQWFGENQAYLKMAELTGHLVSCDEARVYTGETIYNTLPEM